MYTARFVTAVFGKFFLSKHTLKDRPRHQGKETPLIGSGDRRKRTTQGARCYSYGITIRRKNESSKIIYS
jgi:hypothetical protein